MNTREEQINDYIKAYNAFDMAGMLQHLSPDIVFENIADGEVTLSLQGIEAFRAHAEQAMYWFSARQQQIVNLTHTGDQSEAAINYVATLAVDLPNGMKKGDALELSGRSVFTFADGRIVKLADIS